MGKGSYIAKKIYGKEGVLLHSDRGVEIRRSYRVKSRFPLGRNFHEIIEKATEEIIFSFDYALKKARKDKGKIFIEVGNRTVRFDLIEDNDTFQELHLEEIL